MMANCSFIQLIIRQRLRDEGVLAKPEEKANPHSVAPDVLANFLTNGTQGPARPISLDWSVGLHSHLWNTESVSLLAQLCLDDLQGDSDVVRIFKKRSLKLTHDLVQRTIKTKLSKVGRESRHVHENGPQSLEKSRENARTQDRRTTRRNTVRYAMMSSRSALNI